VIVPRGPIRRVLTFALLVAIYFVAGKLGLTLAFVNASATAVWPPTGLAIATLMIMGVRFWPAILVGAFAVNVTTSGNVPSSAGIAIGNTLEAVIAAGLVERWAGGRNAFERPRDVLRFAILAGVLATAVSATIGVASLVLAGLASWADFSPIWLTWWLGDASGALVVAPPLVLWATRDRWPRSPARWAESVLLTLAGIATGLLVFGGRVPFSIQRYPIGFLSFPVLVWAAFRFGPRGAATVALAIGAIAVWGTLNGFGPYALESTNESLLLLQGFMAVAAVTSLALAAAAFDRARTEARLLALEHRSRTVAEDAARVREEFLSIATHELRTPVTSLSGYAQLAERAFVARQTDRIGPALQSIVRQSARLSALITQLLDASHIESGQLDVESRPSDVSTLTTETVEATRLLDGERHSWDVRVEPAIYADVDPLRWGQAVRNLLENAMKYTPPGKRISIRLHRDGDDAPIALEIIDEGIGIAADRLGHVFERFYRAHADDGIGGLGLGLFIARDIVERHRGRIDVASDLGRGTAFTITLPATRGRATGEGETKPSARAAPRRQSSPQRRILVVDDEPDVRALVELVLRDAGHIVIGAKDGEEALALTSRERPDLILLDKLMPTMDGTTFARAYREATKDPAPIVAFCAARDAREWAVSIGAVSYIGKPFDVDDLDQTVRAQLEG
jgi:signal transduction histidine kinase